MLMNETWYILLDICICISYFSERNRLNRLKLNERVLMGNAAINMLLIKFLFEQSQNLCASNINSKSI